MEEEEKNAMRHIVKIRPDKVLSAPELRVLFLSRDKYEDKEVVYYPEEISLAEMDGVRMFFILVAKKEDVKDGEILEKAMTIPLFLLDFAEDQKKELRLMAKKKLKVTLFDFYFNKPENHLSRCSRELEMDEIDFFDSVLEEDENRRIDDLMKPRSKPKPKKLVLKTILEDESKALEKGQEDFFEDLRLKNGGFNNAL